MITDKRCCVPGCEGRVGEKVLHRFPNLNKDPHRFKIWLSAIGGESLMVDHQHINKYYRVCRDHFERRYYNRFNRLCINAVPTLKIKDSESTSTPLLDNNHAMTDTAIAISTGSPECASTSLLDDNHAETDTVIASTTDSTSHTHTTHSIKSKSPRRPGLRYFIKAECFVVDVLGAIDETSFYRSPNSIERTPFLKVNDEKNHNASSTGPFIVHEVYRNNNNLQFSKVALAKVTGPSKSSSSHLKMNNHSTDSIVATSTVTKDREQYSTNTLEMPKVVIGKILPLGNVEIKQQEQLTQPKVLVSKNLQTDKFCPYSNKFNIAVYKDQACFVDLPPLCNRVDESTGVNLMKREKSGCCRKIIALSKKVKNLQKVKEKYAMRLKEITKDIRNHPLFKRAEQKMTKQALGFILMQLRANGKKIKGRRFTQEDKAFALALLQMGRNFYKWFSSIFALPSIITLNRSLQDERKIFEIEQMSAETATAVETLSQPLYPLQHENAYLVSEHELYCSDDIII